MSGTHQAPQYIYKLYLLLAGVISSSSMIRELQLLTENSHILEREK